MNTTINIEDLTPAIAIHPGEFLADELKERNIKQKDFAIMIGMAPTQLNELIKGKRSMTADIALLIGKALSMDAVLWMNLQTGYDLDVAKLQDKNRQRIEAMDTWNMILPMIAAAYFKKTGVIQGNPKEDLPIIKSIYRIEHFDELAEKYSRSAFAHYRKSEKLSVDKINLIGWAHMVQFKTNTIKVSEFDSRSQYKLIEDLKVVLRKNKNTISETEALLAQYGIKFIVLSHPEKCAVDGISFWSNGNPAIGLSLRHKRIDNFAFTLLHELGHVYLHLTSDNEAQFIDMEEPVKNEKEKEADAFALEQLIDNDTWKEFLLDCYKPIDEDFISFAKKHKLHPAIVYGRYCHDKNKYNMRTTIDKQLN